MELLEIAFSAVNLPYTILLIVVVGYWVLYLIGALGSDVLHFHADADVDVPADLHVDVPADLHVDVPADMHVDVPTDMHVDMPADMHVDGDVNVDTDMHVSAEGGGHGVAEVLHFFHVGELPVVLIFSLLVLFMWLLSMVANEAMHNTRVWVAGLLFFPIFVVGLMFTKAILTPFAPYLKQMFDQSSDIVVIIGKICTISSLEVTPEYGQAELPQPGAPMVLNVKTRDGTTLRKGEEAIVYEYEEETNTYLVAKFDVNETTDKET